MRYLTKVVIVCVVLAFLIGLVGFFVIPPVVKPILAEKLSEISHRHVTIAQIAFNPYTLSVTVKGFAVTERGQSRPFVSFDELYVQAQGFYSLLKRAVILKEIRLTRPYIRVLRHEDRTYNFSDLIPPAEAGPEQKKPFYFSLNNIRIIDGSVDFDDKPAQTQHHIRQLNLAIPFISNIGHAVNEYIEPRFSAIINGTPYELVGKTKPFIASKESYVDVNIKDIDIPYYLNYLPMKMNCRLTSARLDTEVKLSFISPESKPPAITLTGSATLRDVALDDLRHRKILRVPTMHIALASVAPMVPDIHLAEISLRAPEVVVRRDRRGNINLFTLLPSGKSGRSSPRTENKTPVNVRVDTVTVEAADVAFIDEVPSEAAHIHLSPLELKGVNLSTERGTKGNVALSLTVNNSGRITVTGPVTANPLSAELAVAVKNLRIRTIQPYFADRIKVHVTGGTVSTTGHLIFAQVSGKKPRMTYTGNLAVSRLSTVDQAYEKEFVNWKQLYFDRLQAGLDPFFVTIRGISLTDFYVRIFINPDGTMNIQQIFGEEPRGAGSGEPAEKVLQGEAPSATPRNIKIGKVTLQGGTIDFHDHFITPNYSATMLNIGGSVTGLSSEEITRATIDLRGNLGHGSPIEITGTINPLIKDLYADVKLRFKDIELSPVTPYASKYLGHPILKGKLTFDVAYLIENRKLDARNNIFIDQLTFGDRVESPEAIEAPVKLAVALLTDRNGRINLDIPLSGSLDDPTFSVWPIIWKVIVNLITKAVTAPFTLLMSLFGGGEERRYIEFTYGSNEMTPEGLKKIDSLAKALYERPNIKIEIAGYVDVENDTEGLKRAEFMRKIKVQKLNDMIRHGEPALPAERVSISPPEFEKYLTRAYLVEKFPKPRTVIGTAKSLPPQEMEKLMLAHIVVTEGDLRALASRRAEVVKGLLLESGKVTSDRLFIVQPASLSPPHKDKVKDSRVDFTLK